MLALDNLKKNDFDKAEKILKSVPESIQKNRLDFIILETLKQYVYVFKKQKIDNKKQNFGNLTLISETFQRCYLDDNKTNSFCIRIIVNIKMQVFLKMLKTLKL